VSLSEAVLPPELLTLPAELARVDALLDDPMFLKFRYRLGYESLCREVRDWITWRRFCRLQRQCRRPAWPDSAAVASCTGPARGPLVLAVLGCGLREAATAKIVGQARQTDRWGHTGWSQPGGQSA
jgi:transposase, IS5 family